MTSLSVNLNNFNGFKIIEDVSMVDTIQDWSGCKSRARAERRLKRGYPQRMKYIKVPKQEIYIFDNQLVMHPEMAKKLREKINQIPEAFKANCDNLNFKSLLNSKIYMPLRKDSLFNFDVI